MMISTTELSLANAIAHGEEFGYKLYFGCEDCRHDCFQIIHAEQKICVHQQDNLRCTRCGSEEADRVLTIIPSWSAPNVARSKLPVWEPGSD